MSKKRILLSMTVAISVFAVMVTFLSLNGFHNWFRQVLFDGAWRHHNMAEEIYHAYPYLGVRSGHFTRAQVLAIFAVSGSVAAYIFTLLNWEYFDVSLRYVLFMLPVMIASVFIATISMTAQDCVLSLDYVIAQYLSPTLAIYINAGPSQLALVSTTMALASVLTIYFWSSNYTKGSLISKFKNTFRP